MSENNCPTNLYQYQENCLVSCPIGTTTNKINATCIDQCTEKNCVSFEPQDVSSDVNIYCPPDMCKPPNDKCFELQCFDYCPSGTYTHRNSCLRHCPEDAKLSYNNTCLSVCPKHTPYIANSECVSACPKSHYIFGNICTEVCPNGYKVFNETCQKECPAGFPFTFKMKNNLFCLNKCPGDTVINDTKCEIDCPKERPLHFNNTCLSRCPEHNIYMVVAKNIHKSIVKCVSKCPQHLLYDENVCVKSCTQDKSKFDNSCLKSCPQTHPYRYNKEYLWHYPRKVEIVCSEKCPINSRISGNNCYDLCPETTFQYNGTCLGKCHDSHPYHQLLWVDSFSTQENTCVSQCFGQFKYAFGKKCVGACPSSLLYMNNTCVKQCSGNFPFLQTNVVVRNSNWENVFRSGCVEKCPGDMVAYRNICIQDCPRNVSFMYNRICVDQCPLTHKFVDIRKRNTCVSICPKNTVIFGNSCLKECPSNSSYILNNICLEKCPNSHPIVDVNNRNNCISECKHVQYKFMCMKTCPYGMLRYNYSCTNVCPEDQPYTDVANSECVKGCPGLQYNKMCLNECINNTYRYLSTCVSDCPKEASYIIKSVRVSYYFYGKKWKWKDVPQKCVPICPSHYFVLGNRCLKFCPKGYNFMFRRHCMKQCPATFLYTSVNIDTVYPSKTLFKCVRECPRNMVYENRMCKYQCSSSSKYVVYKKCHSQCPLERPLHFQYQDNTNSVKYTCFSHCPEQSYRINSTCVLNCPPDMFGFNGNCVEHCPSSHSLNYSKAVDGGFAYFCERICPVNTFRMGQNCYDICPNIYFQFNTSCVRQCPGSHKFHRQAVVHKNQRSIICEDKCPNYSVLNECVTSCPSNQSFIYNQQCVTQCPTMHPLAPKDGDRFCYNSCPNGTLSFQGKHCIKICQNYFFIFNKTCLSKCPSGYNYFEITQQGKVCRNKCVNGFVLSDNECVPKCPVTTYNVQSVCRSIKRCPDNYPFEEDRQQGRTCTDKCLQTNVLDGKFCESGCQYGYVISDSKCVRQCPASSPNELHHRSAFKFQYKIHCYKTCLSGYVTQSNACIPEEQCYNAGYTTHNGVCIPKCLPNFYVVENTISHRRFCRTSCPSGYVLNDNTCILEENCYNLNRYVLNGQCVKDCKFRYYADDDYLKKRPLCGNKCQDDKLLDESGICIKYTSCIVAGKISFNDTCSTLCPPGYYVKTNLFFFKTCTPKCPGIHHNGTHCTQCNFTTILLNGECILRCPTFTLKVTNVLMDHECISAVPIVILLLISLSFLVGSIVLFWYVFIYRCAERSKVRIQFFVIFTIKV